MVVLMKTCVKCGNVRIKGKAYCHKCRPARSEKKSPKEEDPTGVGSMADNFIENSKKYGK